MKRFRRKVLAFLLPPFGAVIIKLLYLSCKKRFFLPDSFPNEPVIIAFWHSELLMQPFLYKKVRKRGKVAVVISDHFDGEIIARVMRFFNISSIRGSSSKRGVKALLEGIKRLKKGYDVGITPDGPRGPRKSVAGGIVTLAKKSGAKIVVFSYAPSKYWQLKSWDRFLIPKPFSTIDFYISEPIDIKDLDMQRSKEYIKKVMLQYSKID